MTSEYYEVSFNDPSGRRLHAGVTVEIETRCDCYSSNRAHKHVTDYTLECLYDDESNTIDPTPEALIALESAVYSEVYDESDVA